MLLRKLLIQFLVLSLMFGAMVVAPLHAASHFQQQQLALDLQQKQVIQLRAAVIVSGSALTFAQADMTSLARQSPGPQSQALEACLVEEHLVICQTGCLSHGEYWRVQDHCKRTGKTCVLVEQPEAVRIVRIDRLEPETAAGKRFQYTGTAIYSVAACPNLNWATAHFYT